MIGKHRNTNRSWKRKWQLTTTTADARCPHQKKNTSNKNFLLFGGGALGPRRWLGHGTTGAAMDNCGGTVVGETVEDARVAGHTDPILVIEAMKQFRFPQLRLELFHKHLGEEISNALRKECNDRRQVAIQTATFNSVGATESRIHPLGS